MLDLAGFLAFFENLGYLGVFVISFIGSIIVFVPIPYFPVLIAAALNKELDPNLVSLSSALGAILAKTIIFYASYYGRKSLSKQTKKRIYPLQKLVAKYGSLAAFIAALTPIPDDLVYIPLGLVKFTPWKFVVSTFLGKFILNEIIVWGSVYLGRPFIDKVISNNIDPITLILVTVASIASLGLLIYLSLKIDWEKIINRWFPGLVDVNNNNNQNHDPDKSA
ncbi:MAG: VTT domain-containing protein [Nitrososphaeraceae archaeon]